MCPRSSSVPPIAFAVILAVGGCVSPSTTRVDSPLGAVNHSSAMLPQSQVVPAAIPGPGSGEVATQPSTAGGSELANKTPGIMHDYGTSNSSGASVFGMDLLLGQQCGIRPSIALLSTEHSSFVVEGFYGGLFTKFGASEGAGAGVRWLTSRGGNDAVTIGPGADVLFNLNHGKASFLAPTVDIAWRHGFGNRSALVLGINPGLGIGLSGNSGNEDSQIAGKVTPLISFYSGLRY